MYIQGWYNIMNKKFSWRAEWIKAQTQVDPPLHWPRVIVCGRLRQCHIQSHPSMHYVAILIEWQNFKLDLLHCPCLRWAHYSRQEPGNCQFWLELNSVFPETRADCIPVASEQDVDGMWGRIERLPRRRISNIGKYLSRWVPSSQCTIG